MAYKAGTRIQALLLTCGAWYLPAVAKAMENRGALAGLWISHRNSSGIAPHLFRRCWPFHLAMKPFYHWAPQIWVERAFYFFFGLWKIWLKSQSFPPANVIHAIYGYATEPFDLAEKTGALKVIDCPNSHPLTLHGIWQRECDLWCPGEKVPIPRWMLGRMTRELERADLVLVLSDFCRESMIQNGIDPAKIMVNPMGVDTELFKSRKVQGSGKRFICVGTICLRKGHQYLFPAMAQVKKRFPDAELICVGNYKRDFRKVRNRWEGTFTHHRSLSHEALARLLSGCTAFVFPSQEEGLPRAQIEAMAAGLPIIGTHPGGASTVVRDGVEGFIVNGKSPASIAEAMIRLIEDPELARRMGKASAAAATRLSWQSYGDRLIEEYGRRLEGRQKKSG